MYATLKATNPDFDRTPSAVRNLMRGNRATDTRPEVAVRSALHRRGLRFFKNRRALPSLRCSCDVVFPRARVVVFVDGCFWHGCPEHGRRRPRTNAAYWTEKIAKNIARDRRNDAALAAAGWEVIRAWEHDDADTVAQRVAAAVAARSSP